MKRELVLVDDNNNKRNPNPNSSSDPNNMFNKFHHHHHHHQEHSATHSPTQNPVGTLALQAPPSHDGATIELSGRRPRGRPPGSKNKPKPPVILSPDSTEPPMSPYVLELPPGSDIIESTTRFCRKRNIGLCILNGNGAVANVTLKQPSTTPGSTVTFHGRFEVLSITGTIFPAGGAVQGNGSFAISLAGPQGQVVGGIVVGPLVAAGVVYLIASTFNSPSFHRLQSHDNDESPVSGGGEGTPPPPQQQGGGGSYCNYPANNSDVIWAPSARQPPPPPPPY